MDEHDPPAGICGRGSVRLGLLRGAAEKEDRSFRSAAVRLQRTMRESGISMVVFILLYILALKDKVKAFAATLEMDRRLYRVKRRTPARRVCELMYKNLSLQRLTRAPPILWIKIDILKLFRISLCA